MGEIKWLSMLMSKEKIIGPLSKVERGGLFNLDSLKSKYNPYFCTNF